MSLARALRRRSGRAIGGTQKTSFHARAVRPSKCGQQHQPLDTLDIQPFLPVAQTTLERLDLVMSRGLASCMH